jgi:hypothetical protein
VSRERGPHILPLFDSGEADELLFYMMPCVEGESLRARLDREAQRIHSAASSALVRRALAVAPAEAGSAYRGP